jgi:glucose/arabinose dehydrogenase
MALVGSSVTATAATLPAGFTESQVATGLSSPTAMAFAPDGRLFVTRQGGEVRVIKNGALLPTPFVTLNVNFVNEGGLIGIAFDPNFATNQYVYLHYVVPPQGAHFNRVSRFTANGDVAVPGSEVVLLDIDPTLDPRTNNHHGGALHFTADGKLLIAVGERTVSANAQSMSNLFGKILRMNPDGTIPTDNPFYNTATGNNRLIWALGLRNPYTLDVQPGTGRVFINDVGQSTWESINEGVAGSNYGWPTTGDGDFSNTTYPQFRRPIHVYPWAGSQACTVIGAAFYNPAVATFPTSYVGKYFFADLCGNWIHMLDPANGNAVTDFASSTASQIIDLETGPDGALYYIAQGSGGVVRRISFTETRPQTVYHPFFAVDLQQTPYVGDWNGDGRTDLIVFARDSATAFGDVYVSLSQGTSFEPTSTKWHDFFAISPAEQVVIGDYNGDGRDDIATWLSNTTRQVYVALSQAGGGMGPAQVWAPSIGTSASDVLYAGDADGDGKDDIIAFARTEGRVYAALSNGATFGTPAVWHGFFAVSTYERPRVADVNGDGRADIVTFATDSPTAFGDVYVAVSNGTRFVHPVNGTDSSDKWHDFFAIRPTEEVRIGELNGDSRQDFFTFLPMPFGQCYTALSQGTSMGPSVLWREQVVFADTDRPFVGDVNGDGRSDIIIFAQSLGRVYVSLAP